MNWKESEKTKRAAELAKQITALDGDLLSVEIIDEPGHLIGDYVQDGHKPLRTASKEAWQTASFQQALFFFRKAGSQWRGGSRD